MCAGAQKSERSTTLNYKRQKKSLKIIVRILSGRYSMLRHGGQFFNLDSDT